MVLSEDSSIKCENPTFFLEGVVKDRSDMVDFEGPLNLILQLLSKNKIAIRDISVAEILDQYLEYLDEMQRMDLEIASEFVQMASYLLYLKTRMLLREEEARSELEQLIASLEQLRSKDTYAALKTVLPALEEASRAGLQYYAKEPEPLPKRKGEYPYSIEAADLLRALLTVYTRGNAREIAAAPLLQTPQRIVYSVRAKSGDLIRRLRTRSAVPLSELYALCESRSEVVATFLSVLELCSMGCLLLTERDGGYVADFIGGDAEQILKSIVE